MFELSTRNEQKWFIQLLNNTRWYDVWKTMNEVKPIHLIPGLNMMTVYQLSEYFEVPIMKKQEKLKQKELSIAFLQILKLNNYP